MKIGIVSFSNDILRWERGLASALQSAGYQVQIDYRGDAPAARFLKAALAMERLAGKASAEPPPFASSDVFSGEPDVIVDLTGNVAPGQVPVLSARIGDRPTMSEGLLRLRSGSGLVEIVAYRDGRPVGRASPMIHDKVWLSRDIGMLLVSVHALFIQTLARLRTGCLEEIDLPPVGPMTDWPALTYARRFAGGIAARMMKRLTPGSRDFSWRTGYRFIDGPGIADTLRIDGPSFSMLADDGERFYADPFPIIHEGRCMLFVEEYPHALGRGVISVAELGADGQFGRPRVVLEEAHHLSYPNVFAHDGAVFMIPESGAAQEVVLYRADPFPDRWLREAVLIEGRTFSDATLFVHQGRYWMFGTERFNGGNPSDTMAVYHATSLRGPWLPHPLNPILIDRSGARPGGRIIEKDGKFFLPVQDGAEAYGAGLGLREILVLDTSDIRFGPVQPIQDAAGKGPASLHTLNRVGRLEVIDMRA